MQTQLYPAEYAEDSLERLLAERSRRSHAVYLAVIATLLAALGMLPFAHVDVSTQSTGIIRPVTEKHEVKARASGLVEQLFVRENDRVRAGQPILVLRSAAIEEQRRLLAAQVGEHQRSIADLETLAKAARAGATAAPFQTPRYAQSWAQFRNDVGDAEQRRQRASREAARTRTLGTANVAAMDVEEKDFELAQARAALALVRDRYLSQWQGELAQARTEVGDLLAQQGKADEELSLYTVTAPVAGTVDEMPGVSPGSFVIAGDAIAVISPSAELQAEIYVTPRDIGTLRPGTIVRLQVDAFNYSDWGMVTGRVREISDDYVTVNQQPVFKVKCSLDQDHLSLASGFRGRLKKGMTLRARFFVARRTLLQLLYENVDDWLNPGNGGQRSS